MKRTATLAALLTAALVACPSSPAPSTGTINLIEIAPAAASIKVGGTHTFQAVAKDASGHVLNDTSFTWAAANPSVAAVNAGNATGLKAGTTAVTASAGGVTSAPAALEVTEAAPFTLTPRTSRLPVPQGGEAALTVDVTRDTGFTAAVTVTVSGLPAGTVAEPVTVPEGATSADITVRAAPNAPHSTPTTARLEGAGGGGTARQDVTVTVTGPARSLDTSFSGGKVVVPVGSSEDYAHAIAVQADGKLVIAGDTTTNAGTKIAVLRLERDGALDASFGQNGKVTAGIGNASDQARAVAVQPDGKILVAGSSDSGAATSHDFALLRFNANGTLDASFGNGGKVVTPISSGADRAYALLVQPDGKIIAAGNGGDGTSGLDFALARYTPSGALDGTFGTNGVALTPIASQGASDTVRALAFQDVNGETRILAAGGDGDFKLARYTSSGALDASFGVNGKLTGVNGSSIGGARAIAVSAGKILVAGHVSHDFALARLDANGALDASFAGGGRTTVAVSATNWDEAEALAVQADGKVLLGGWVYEGNSSSANFTLVRFGADGAIDAGFGTNGVTVTSVAAPTKDDAASALALQPDDRVPTVRAVLAGAANGSNRDFAVTRYWP